VARSRALRGNGCHAPFGASPPFLRRDFLEAWWWTRLGHKQCVARSVFRVVIASVSEAIQRLAREAGLLRRFAPRNDDLGGQAIKSPRHCRA
jgi:hypothetical protein